MSVPPGGGPFEVLLLPPDREGVLNARALERSLPDANVRLASSLADAASRYDAAVDCVVSGFRVPGGTAIDLRERAGLDADRTPHVVVVEAEDGRVPVEAVGEQFADLVPATAEDDATAAVRESIETAVSERRSPRLAGDWPSDRRALNDRKASILDQFFTKIPQHLFVKDASARNVMISEAAVSRRIHRLSDDYLGKRDIDGVVPVEEAREPYEDDLAVIRTGEPILEKEEYYPTSSRWFRTSKVPWEENGDVVGVLGASQEITEEKKRERQLEIVNHHVRHAMRNDLNAVAGWIDVVRNREDGDRHREDGDRHRDDEILDRVSRITDRLCNRVEKQQAIVDAVSAEPEPAPRDLSAVVEGELRAVADEYESLRIDADIEPDVTAVADEGVDQVVRELIENAVQHSEGRVPEIGVTLHGNGDRAEIHVRDDCTPIPTYEREILTGEREIDQLNHSSGLGLWLVRWLVENSEGRVEFGRTDVGGNDVAVTFPSPG
ncbi:hypothetical protein GCM10027435_05790 [Haloparvum alkalitolerans]|uniref:sensor histidine kinase n=1 Tax=Haloparvum alkalitolerans TaxID=1042953 RepID=UPI003CF3DA11